MHTQIYFMAYERAIEKKIFPTHHEKGKIEKEKIQLSLTN